MVYKKIITFIILISFAIFISAALQAQALDEAAGSGMMSNPKIKSAMMSALFPGLGQLANNQKTKAYIFIGTGAVLLSSTIFMALSANKLWGDYADNRPYADFDTPDDRVRYDKYAKQADTTTILLGVTLAFWTYNIVDAYLYAPKGSSSAETVPLSEDIEKAEEEVSEEIKKTEELEEAVDLKEVKDIEKEMEELEKEDKDLEKAVEPETEEEPQELEEEVIPAEEETGEPELEESTESEEEVEPTEGETREPELEESTEPEEDLESGE